VPPPPPTGKPSLSPRAQVELKKCLGAKAATEIIPVLQDVLQAFPWAQNFVKPDLRRRRTSAVQRQLEKHLGPLQALVAAIRVVQDDLAPLAPEEQPAWRDLLDRLFVEIITHTGKLDYLFNYSQSHGRPRNEARRWLANNVAYMLRRSGIPLGKTHGDDMGGGAFHCVLKRAIQAAEGQSPIDLYPLLRETADMFDHFTQEFLDEIDPPLIGYLRLPKSGVLTLR
jgi:hypothetical protein